MSDFLEKNLEDIIFENREIIQMKGFPLIHKNLLRQFRLPSGKKIDLFSFNVIDDDLHCSIFELKREKLGVDSLLQLLQYKEEVLVFASPHFKQVNIELYLVGSDYDSSIQLIHNQHIAVDIYLYKYLIDGIRFKRMKPLFEMYDIKMAEVLYSEDDQSLSFYNSILEAHVNLNPVTAN